MEDPEIQALRDKYGIKPVATDSADRASKLMAAWGTAPTQPQSPETPNLGELSAKQTLEGGQKIANSITTAADRFKAVPDLQTGSHTPILEAAGNVAKKTGNLLEGALGAASGAVQSVFAPLTATVQKVAQTGIEDNPAVQKLMTNPTFSSMLDAANNATHPMNTWAKENPRLATDLMDGFNVLLTAAGAGPADPVLSAKMKTGFDTYKSVASDIATKTKEVAQMPFDAIKNAEPIAKLKGYADTKIKDSISTDIDSLLTATRPIGKKVQEAEARGIDFKSTLSDPQVFKGIKVVNSKINPDEAITVIQNRIDKVMDAKHEMLPKIDSIVPEQSRELLREKAIANVKGKYLEADEADLIDAINRQIDALPETLKVSDIDKIRAKARSSSRNAKGQMKSQSEYAAIENAARDFVFEITDNLPVSGAQEYKALNDYVKNMIVTKDFLDTTVRNQVVKGGRLRGYVMRVIGSMAGSSHGIVGAIAGSEIGGVVADIITNNALGSSIKMNLIRNITDDPAIIQQAERLLGEIKDLNVPQLPEGSGYRSQTFGAGIMKLPAKSQSTIDAQERVNPNISRQNVANSTISKNSISPNTTTEAAKAQAPADVAVVDAFNASKGQEKVGSFELGSFGKNAIERKVSQADRFPINELSETQKHIIDAYKASANPKSYRSDNIAWVAKMPDGEMRVIYTRQNVNGAEEIINAHKITDKNFIKTLKSFGTPDQIRTGILSLEGSAPNPLADGGIGDTTTNASLLQEARKTKSQLTNIWNKANKKQP